MISDDRYRIGDSIYDIDPQRRQGAWMFMVFAILFFLTFIIIGFVLAAINGHGTGFGDGRLKPSLHTPGGPYYPSED